MAHDSTHSGNRWVAFFVIGLGLNTLGIALADIGWFRYALMAIGIGLLLYAVVLVTEKGKVNGGEES